MRNIYIFCGLLVITACANIKKMNKNYKPLISYEVKPSILEVHKDKTTFKVEAKIPPKYFVPKASIQAVLYLADEKGNEITEIGSVSYQGDKVTGNETVIPYKEGGNFKYEGTFDYNKTFDNSQLGIKITATQGKKSIEFEKRILAKGLILTSKYPMNDDKFMTTNTHNFVRTTSHNMQASIHYELNSSVVKKTEIQKENIQSIINLFKDIDSNEKLRIKHIEIRAFASPEGELSENTDLANQRANSFISAILTALKKHNVELSKDVFNIKTTGEDWAGFQEKISQSSIEDRELILRILRQYTDVERREKEIKNLSETYTEIKKEILPALRRSTMEITYEKDGKSDKELLEFSTVDSIPMTAEELMLASILAQKDVVLKHNIYKRMITNFNDWRAHTNFGVYLITEKGDIQEAEQHFKKAYDNTKNDITANNYGAIRRKQDATAEANEILQESKSEEASYNLGLIDLKNGDYKDAINRFGKYKTNSLALAYILNKKYKKALDVLGNVAYTDADTYYLISIVGARKNNFQLMIKNLKTLLQKYPKYKNSVSEDMEFLNYRDREEFKALLL